MSDQKENVVMGRVRRALKRERGGVRAAPAPPVIDDSVARLVRADADLVEVFTKNAKTLSMKVVQAMREELNSRILEFLRVYSCRKIALANSHMLDRLGVFDAVKGAGIDVKRWSEITLDELYDGYDCAITDVEYAVAETGTLVVKPSVNQGRGLTLVPMHHIAIVQESQFLPDLVDLMPKLAHDPDRSNFILISGPSKTADIEMTVVTGVHGPNVVQTFVVV